MDIGARAWMVAAAALCLCSVGSAGTNSWTAVGPAGGLVQKVAYNPANPSIVYMISEGGFLRSEDGGVTWQTINNNFFNPPHDLAVDPSDPTRVYVVTPNAPYLLMSTDSGATLSAVASFPTNLINPWDVQVSQDGTLVCVAATLNIVCSADHARTWTLKTPVEADSSPGGRVFKLLFDPTNSATLYASAGDLTTQTYGFFVSHDGATTWQQLASTTDSDNVAMDLAYSPGSPALLWAVRYNGLWYSSDGGVTWNVVSALNALNPYSSPWIAAAVSPVNPNLVYVGSSYGQVFTWDNSAGVATNVSGKSLVGEIASITPHPTQSTTVLVAGDGGLWGSVDAGATWNEQVNGLLATQVIGLSADPQSDRIYIGVATGGLYCLANGADAATPLNNTAAATASLGLQNYIQINTVLAQAGTPGALWAGVDAGLEESLDGGNSWSRVTGSLESYALASSPAAPQTVLAATGAGVSRTADGGATWVNSNTGFPAGASVSLLAASAADPNVFYATPQTGNESTSYGVYRSSDAGQSWSAANAGMTSSGVLALVVDPTNANVVYASAGSSLQKSTDGGATWTALQPFGSASLSLSGYVAIDPAHPQIIYAGAYGIITRSVDGGATWETILNTQSVSHWLLTAMLVDPNRTSNLLVGTEQSGVQEITIAPDLALQVSAPSGPIGVGAASVFQYSVNNNGPFSATGVQVTLQLPTGAQGIGATPSQGTCTVASTTVTCALGTLANGSSATVALTATAAAVGAFQITGSVQADQPDSDTTNNSVTSNSTAAPVADVSVTVTGTTTVQVGNTVTYTATVANAGPNTATATALTFGVTTALDLGTVTASAGSCTTAARQVTCNLGDLAAAASATVTINANATTAGTTTSTASVTTTAADPATANNSTSVTTTVNNPATQPPPASSGSHGGGGAIGAQWLLVLLGALGLRLGRRNAQ